MREYITQKLIQVGAKVAHSKSWLHFKHNYPRTHAIVKNRITLKDFSGLPITLLVLAMAVNLLLLTRFTEDVINYKSFIDIDNSVSRKLFSVRSNGMVKFFYYFTQVGRLETVIFVCLSAIAISVWREKNHFIVPILIALLGCSLTMYLGKKIFKIQRPYELSYYHIDNYSFPSGHSAVAVAFYGLLFYFFIRHNYSFRKRMILFSSAVAFAGMIGFSRLYLCEHFLSDVIAGYLLGALWLMVSISTLEWEQFKLLKQKPHDYL